MSVCQMTTPPEYGRSRFGIGKDASYRCARNGEWVAVHVGRRVFIAVEATDAKLGIVISVAPSGHSLERKVA